MNILENPIVTVDVLFIAIGSTAFGVDSLELQQGQKVKVQLNLIPSPAIKKIEWFANNDPVLNIQENNTSAVIEAAEEGSCRIDWKIKNKVVRSMKFKVVKKQVIATHGEIIFSKPQ